MNNYEYFQENYGKQKMETLEEYIQFCKQETRLKIDDSKVKDEKNIKNKILYYNDNDNDIDDLKHSKLKNVPLYYLRKFKFNKIDNAKLIEVNNSTGIYKSIDDLHNQVQQLLPGSFAIAGEFTLAAPYYSADDDHYNIFDNPLLKDKVYKVPMMRGSSWKGIIAAAARQEIETDFSIEKLLSFGRLFGSGSEEFRKIEKEAMEKKYKTEFEKMILNYALIKFGKVTMNNIDNDELTEKLWEKIAKQELQTQRGRLILFPSFFDRIGMEMINPHKRRTKAGTAPIYYEVVSRGAIANFQLFYIPADDLYKDNKTRIKRINSDLNLLTSALRLIFQENGTQSQIFIGAKTKLGWGRISPCQLRIIKTCEDENSNLFDGGI